MAGHEPTDVIDLDGIARAAARESRSSHTGFWVALSAALLLMVGVLLVTLYTYGQTQDLASQQSTAAMAAQKLQGQVLALGAKPVTQAPAPVSGEQGAQGATGPAGRGITATHIVAGDLYIVYTDGSSVDLGKVVGDNGTNGATGATGADGRGISSTKVSSTGDLIVTYTDGTPVNVGHVVGPQGAQGASGAVGQTGATGTGIASASITDDGLLVLTYTDGTSQTVGPVVGPKGDTGATGQTGATGPPGADGTDGQPPLSWTYTDALGLQHTCSRVDGFDPNAPRYTCS